MRAIYTDEYLEKNDFHLTQSIIDSLYENVYTDYTNRVDSVFYKLSFEYRGEFDHYEFYKKTTKKHKEGDFKSVVYKYTLMKMENRCTVLQSDYQEF